MANAALLAKAALRRLAADRLEPTPENFARAYSQEGGPTPPPSTPAAPEVAVLAWGPLLDRLVRGLNRGGREWTGARRRESVHRLLASSGSADQRLHPRLLSLLGAWDSDVAADDIELAEEAGGERTLAVAVAVAVAAAAAASATASAAATPAAVATPVASTAAPTPQPAPISPPAGPTGDRHWQPLAASLGDSLRAALPEGEARAAALAERLGQLAARIATEGASAALVDAVQAACADARRLFAHRHHLVEALSRLCLELGDSMVDLVEDDSWVRGQCEALRLRLAEGLNARGVRAASELLAQTRQRQAQLRGDRNEARDALKMLVQRLLHEVGDLDANTGRFAHRLGRHAEAIARADTLAGVAAIVRELVEESQAVQAQVHGARERLADDQARAAGLEHRVRELEGEMRRLSDEVTTDALTQVANRRGLSQLFESECARAPDRGAAVLSVALLDIDNFKKLNDALGHLAGDRALQKLAAAVRERLRPDDHLARFGGEEFVVLLPATPAAEARRVLTRLQRSLTESLFLHEGREVFVTFSCGVTAWRPGEPMEVALERADEAMYEAKRTGKNRSCVI